MNCKWQLAAAGSCLLVSLGAHAVPIDPYTGEGSPIAGAEVVATGGHVIATFVHGSGSFDDYLYLASPGGPFTNASPGSIGANWIFENHLSTVGDTVDLGNFAAGTVLIFNILADTHGSGLQNWFSGPASRNADSQVHAIVDSAYTGPFGGTLVGFEDCFPCGGTGFFEDLRYSFTNVVSAPEPDALALLGAGAMIGVVGFRRKDA